MELGRASIAATESQVCPMRCNNFPTSITTTNRSRCVEFLHFWASEMWPWFQIRPKSPHCWISPAQMLDLDTVTCFLEMSWLEIRKFWNSSRSIPATLDFEVSQSNSFDKVPLKITKYFKTAHWTNTNTEWQCIFSWCGFIKCLTAAKKQDLCFTEKC